MKPMRAVFRCFAGCSGEFPLTQAIYRCPKCDGLLEVSHDLEALGQRSGEAWKNLFETRYKKSQFPYSSGVWGKREWVMPQVPDESIVTTNEGGSNLFPAKRLANELGMKHLWLKLCGDSHTGSFKDLGMTALVSMVNHAVKKGDLSVRAIACASTGDTSAALAAYGAIAGLPVVVLLPNGLVSTAQLVQPLAHGAKVIALDTDFDGCMAVIRELAARGLVYLANSMNPLRIEGQKTVAIEVTQQLDWNPPDWIILPSGNLGNAAALHAGFRMMCDLGVISKMPRLCVAQAENANPMYRAYVEGREIVTAVAAKKSLASAIQIGNPVSAPRAVAALKAMRGVVEQASEEELADAAARADRTGLYTCPHTGVALACMFKLIERGTISRDERVVVISTASGLKFTEFKLGYHESSLAVPAHRANRPVVMPADVEQVAAALESGVSS